MTSISVASIPVTSALVGVLVLFVKTEWFLIVSGVLVILACPLFVRSEVVNQDKQEN